MLLDLDDGSLRFFKNGRRYGPGYPAGSVTGPVVHAAQLFRKGHGVQLLGDAQTPELGGGSRTALAATGKRKKRTHWYE